MHGRLLVTAFSLGMIVPIMASSTAAWAADPGGAVVVRSGTVDQVVIDGLPGQDDALRTQTLVNVGGRMLDVPAAMGAGLRGGQAVSIRLQTPPGSGDAAALSQAKVLAVSASGTTVATSVAAAGAHTLTVLPVYWAAPDSATTASLTSLATGTAAYWAEQSDNQINISTSVQAWKKITNPAGTCNATALLNAALAAHRPPSETTCWSTSRTGPTAPGPASAR
jgi:hypothetical protein